jgi:hypothetical protein
MKKIRIPLLAGLLLCLAIFTKANDGKSEICLHGHVTDAVTKKPVQGVTVSATVPGINISKEVITDAEGYFSFTQLPASQVNIQFDKKGYQSYRKSGVTVREKTSIKVNIEFLPENFDATSEESEYPLLRMLEMN